MSITALQKFADQYGELQRYLKEMGKALKDEYKDIFKFKDRMAQYVENANTNETANMIRAGIQGGYDYMGDILTGKKKNPKRINPIIGRAQKEPKAQPTLADELGSGYSDVERTAIENYLKNAEQQLGDAYKREEAIAKATERIKLIREDNEEKLREIYNPRRQKDKQWKGADLAMLQEMTGVEMGKSMNGKKIDQAMRVIKANASTTT